MNKQVKIIDSNNAYFGRVATVNKEINHAVAGKLYDVYVSNEGDTSRVSFICKPEHIEAVN